MSVNVSCSAVGAPSYLEAVNATCHFSHTEQNCDDRAGMRFCTVKNHFYLPSNQFVSDIIHCNTDILSFFSKLDLVNVSQASFYNINMIDLCCVVLTCCVRSQSYAMHTHKFQVTGLCLLTSSRQ